MKTVQLLANDLRRRVQSPGLSAALHRPATLLARDAAGVPLIHLVVLTERLTQVPTRYLRVKVLEAVWGPGWTTVHAAALQGSCGHLTPLLRQPAYAHLLHWVDQAGDTPVHLAARHGLLEQFGDLFADPSLLAHGNRLAQTPVHVAALAGCAHQLLDFLTPRLLAQRDLCGLTALDLIESRDGWEPRGEEPRQRWASLAHQTKVLLRREPRTVADVFEEFRQRRAQEATRKQ